MKTTRTLIMLSFILLIYGSCLPSQKPVQAKENDNAAAPQTRQQYGNGPIVKQPVIQQVGQREINATSERQQVLQERLQSEGQDYSETPEEQNFNEEASEQNEKGDAAAEPKATQQRHEGLQPGGHIYGYGPAFQ